MFPMAHTAAILEGRRAARNSLAIPLFDGTDNEGAEDSTVVVLGLEEARAQQVSFAVGSAKHPRPAGVLRPGHQDRCPQLPGGHAFIGPTAWLTTCKMDFGNLRGGRQADESLRAIAQQVLIEKVLQLRSRPTARHGGPPCRPSVEVGRRFGWPARWPAMMMREGSGRKFSPPRRTAPAPGSDQLQPLEQVDQHEVDVES